MNSSIILVIIRIMINSMPILSLLMMWHILQCNWFWKFQSQHVRQGTVAPTHYNVMADKHWTQTRSYAKTCLQQANSFELQLTWNGSCSSPCWYAHKLAFLFGQSLHREPSLDNYFSCKL